MPRYYFHTADGHRWSDPEGSELPDEQTARAEAVTFAAEVLRGKAEEIWRDGQWRVEVTDDQNALLCTVIVLGIDAPRPYPLSGSSG